MEWLSSSLSALNGNAFGSIFLVLLLLVLLVGVKKGAISFKGHGLVVKAAGDERTVLQRQTTFIHGQMDAIGNILVKEHPDLDKYKILWVCKCIELELIRSIHYNHITDTEGYKSDRFIAIKAIVQKKVQNQYFFSKDFDDFLNYYISIIIKQLVKIRKMA